jgi:hypothetical protein
VRARLGEQCGDVLAFERDRRALRVVLVIAAAGAVRGAGENAGELALEFGHPEQRLRTRGFKPGASRLGFSHIRRLSLKATILLAGYGIIPAHLAL